MRALLISAALLSLAACNLPPRAPEKIVNCEPYEEVHYDTCFPKR